MPFDSHCHFEPGDDIPALLSRARAAGLSGLLAVGGSPEADAGARAAAAAAPGFAFAAFGLEPGMAADIADPRDLDARMAALEAALLGAASPDGRAPPRSAPADSPDGRAPPRPAPADSPDGRAPPRPIAAAIGEIGLDYSRGEDAAARARQRALFAAQLRLAARLGLPCSIHSRGAEEDTVAVLRENLSPDLVRDARAGSLHCFVGPADFAAALVPLGLSFGLSGIVTFRSADALRALVPALPRDRLLVETDSPYLAPVPLRGRPCEPAFVVHTARRVAALLGLPEPDAFALFAENARRIFVPPSPSESTPPPRP